MRVSLTMMLVLISGCWCATSAPGAQAATPTAAEATPVPNPLVKYVGLFGDGVVQQPSDVAIGPDDSVWITDMATDQLLQFDPDGNLIRKFGETGNGPGQFEFADFGAIDLDADGNVYVLDTGNQRIQKFSPDLDLEIEWGGNGSGPGEFLHPSDLAVRDDGTSFVVDAFTPRVQQFDPSGKFVGEIVPTGISDQFFEPARLSLDSAGNLYVPDLSRIYVFDSTDTLARTIQTNEIGNGTVYVANGAAVSDSGSLYVSDWQSNRVAVFDPDGAFVGDFGGYGTGPSQFNEVDVLVMDGAGQLMVLDFANQRIQVFALLELPSATPVAALPIQVLSGRDGTSYGTALSAW